jgi:uncharacterized protein YjeT (DUF2065 family)
MMMLVVEGLIYFLFPNQMKQMLAMLLAMPAEKIRTFAFGMMVVGAIGIWFYTSGL